MAILLKISNLHGANIYCTSPFEETWTVTDSDDIPSFDENIKIIGDGCVEDLEVFIAKIFDLTPHLESFTASHVEMITLTCPTI